jgi:frataxin-like iron-binding protein CyaY
MSDQLTDQQFRLLVDRAVEQVERSLAPLAESAGFDLELQNGVLNVVFEAPSAARFVISPNAPVRRVSALGRGYKLGWASGAGAFMLDGESLVDLVGRLVRQHLG